MAFDSLREEIARYCEANCIQGVLRVTIAGKPVFAQNIGFADVNTKTPFTDASMFSLYSLSKPFCAIGLLKLMERGLVDIDVHPSRYVPEAVGFNDRVTIRHLLHHISGLPDFEQIKPFVAAYAPGYARFTRAYLKRLAEYPSYFPPGTNALYSNVNFVLCALIIENVTGQCYSDYMQREIFAPLGMLHAVVDDETLTIPNRVTGYELVNGQLTEVEKSHDWLLGAGDIVATAEDVYCLNKAIKNRLLLREDTWQMVLTPSPLNKMGMGCTVTVWHGKKRINHNGGHTGFRTLHIQLPEDDFDIIFLSNSGFGNARNDIAELLHAAFYKEDGSLSERFEMDKGYI